MSGTLTDRDWQRLDELYEEALRQPPDRVDAFCEQACGDNRQLHAFLKDLVASSRLSDGAIRGAIADLARDVAGDRSLAGERVGAYRFERLLGRGGMGEVYLASRADGEFEKKVAVKLIRASADRDRIAELFRNERQVMAALSHPSIPTLVDAGQLDDGRPYFICDYIDGLPVDDYCTGQSLSVEQRLVLLGKIADALQHAHANLVLHLDIKPENILVQPDGTPVLLDFGIARLMHQQQTAYRAFSPSYASPEQLRGEHATASSDVFALGALMYRLLTGEAPVNAPRYAPSQTLFDERAQFYDRSRASGALTALDEDLAAIVAKAMAEQPADRYPSADAFATDLKNFLSSVPVSARPNTLVYRATKYVRRHRLAVAVAAAVFVTLAAFGVREFDLRVKAQEAERAAAQARDEADTAYRSAARDAESAQRTAAFLTEVFRVAEPGSAQAADVTARDLLDRAADRIADDLDSQPLISAHLMHTMADAYVNLGAYDKGLELSQRALALRDAHGRTDDVETARLLNSLAEANIQQARFDDAMVALDRALAIPLREEPGHVEARAVSHKLTGQVLRLTDRLDEATKAYGRSVDLYRQAGLPDSRGFARSLVGLGSIHGQSGRLAEAEPLYVEALAMMERTQGPDHYDLTRVLNSMGNLYVNMGRLDDAVTVLNRSRAIRESVLDPDHPQLAFTHLNLAVVRTEQEAYEQAQTHYLTAIEILEKNFEPDDFRLALVRFNLGSTYERMDRLDDSERLTRAALAAWDGKLPPDHQYIGGAYRVLANVHEKRGNNDEAYVDYERARAILGRLPADNVHRMGLVEEYARFLRSVGDETRAAALEAELTADVPTSYAEPGAR